MAATETETALPVYVHVDRWEGTLGALDRTADRRPGWIVHNAPRPLFGTHAWEGPFRAGCFYAAIDPADPNAERWESENLRLDARRVELVTNDDVAAILAGKLDANGYTLDDYAEVGMTFADVAFEYGLPWSG